MDEEEEDSIRLRGLSLIIMILFKKIFMKIDSQDKNEPDRRLVGRQAAVCHRDIVRWLNLRCQCCFWIVDETLGEETLEY